jgi:hypothetical protein
LAVSAAFTDRERTRGPGFRDKSRSAQGQRQGKHKQRAALRGNG